MAIGASDLLQANCVIWVEGPSDRIDPNAWIKAAAAEIYEDLELEEGIDYQVMFYGGGLAAHLTLASGPEDVLDQIHLHRLNQRTVVVADSDRRADSDELKERVKRLQRESEGDPYGNVWVTAGRTIENYIDDAAITAAILRIHPTVESCDRSSIEVGRSSFGLCERGLKVS